MSIKKLTFTKDWTDPDDFPAFEENEGKVRADMQLLHDEAKTHINDVLKPAIDELQNRAESLSADQHQHSNKNLLDSYTQTNDNLKTAVSQSHFHDNQNVLMDLTEDHIAVLNKVQDVTQTLGNATNKVPSEKAVADAMAANGNIPSGGTTGQVLVKASSTARDVTWKTLDAAAVGALPDDTTAADIGALPDTTKAADIGALPDTAVAADVGALSTAGGDLTGSLNIKATSPAVRLDHTGQNARAQFTCVGHSLTVGMFDAAGSTNNARQLYVRDASGSFSSIDRMIEMYVTTNGSSKYYKVLTEANKPAGATYKGNAAARTVATGGIGGVLLVHSSSYTAIVTDIGAFVFRNDTVVAQPNHTGAVYAYRFIEGITYSGGSLVLDDSEYLNNSGTTYTYQVL